MLPLDFFLNSLMRTRSLTTVMQTEGAHEHHLLIDYEFHLILLKHKSEKTIGIV